MEADKWKYDYHCLVEIDREFAETDWVKVRKIQFWKYGRTIFPFGSIFGLVIAEEGYGNTLSGIYGIKMHIGWNLLTGAKAIRRSSIMIFKAFLNTERLKMRLWYWLHSICWRRTMPACRTDNLKWSKGRQLSYELSFLLFVWNV